MKRAKRHECEGWINVIQTSLDSGGAFGPSNLKPLLEWLQTVLPVLPREPPPPPKRKAKGKGEEEPAAEKPPAESGSLFEAQHLG